MHECSGFNCTQIQSFPNRFFDLPTIIWPSNPMEHHLVDPRIGSRDSADFPGLQKKGLKMGSVKQRFQQKLFICLFIQNVSKSLLVTLVFNDLRWGLSNVSCFWLFLFFFAWLHKWKGLSPWRTQASSLGSRFAGRSFAFKNSVLSEACSLLPSSTSSTTKGNP